MQYVVGRNNIALAYNGKLMGVTEYTLPPYTLRVEFSDLEYVPRHPQYTEATIEKVQGVQTNQWDVWYESSDWTHLLSNMPDQGSSVEPTYKVIEAGDISGVTNMHGLFSNTNLTETCWFDTSNVTNMYEMFAYTTIRTIPNLYTHNVTNMQEMFDHCYNLEVIPWMDTSNVTTMEAMMEGTQIVSFPELDTHKVTSMWDMFRSCLHLKDVPMMDTSNVVTMKDMFYDCASLETIPTFNTSKVKNMSGILRSCLKLRTVPLFDVTSLEDISIAFSDDYRVESGALALYNRAKEVIPPENTSAYIYAFRDCGAWTETGAAELAQIPESWK